MDDLLYAIKNVQIVDRDSIVANNWNPNVIGKDNIRLLIQSIMSNGFTTPIVIRKDRTILDGYHRHYVSGMEPLKSKLGGKVPVVIVEHEDESQDMYATITYNRARGTHQLEPMKAIVKRLISQGKTVKEIGRELGMKPEEVFRLSDFTRDDFLKIMIDGAATYNRAYVNQNIK
jgi:ParB-like chromosome segregation protein Spo0J